MSTGHGVHGPPSPLLRVLGLFKDPDSVLASFYPHCEHKVTAGGPRSSDRLAGLPQVSALEAHSFRPYSVCVPPASGRQTVLSPALSQASEGASVFSLFPLGTPKASETVSSLHEITSRGGSVGLRCRDFHAGLLGAPCEGAEGDEHSGCSRRLGGPCGGRGAGEPVPLQQDTSRELPEDLAAGVLSTEAAAQTQQPLQVGSARVVPRSAALYHVHEAL